MKTRDYAGVALLIAAIGFFAPSADAQDEKPGAKYEANPKVVYQNLTEIFRRRPYLHTKNMEKLIRGWDCPGELLIFNDVDTGAEVWRLTWNPSYDSIHTHINRSPWNADGSVIGFLSNRGMPGVWKRETTGLGDPHPYRMKGDGSSFELFHDRVPGFTTLFAAWWSWDREDPNKAYWVTHKALWRTTFMDNDSIIEKVVDLPNVERRKQLFAPVGEDGIIMVKELNSHKYEAELHIVDVKKDKIIHSYPIAMGLKWPKHDVKMEFGFHDCTFRRNKENSYVINYGSQGSVGEYLFFEFPLDGDKSKVKIAYPSAKDPNIPYYSHPAWGPGGKLISYFGLEEFGPAEKNPGWHVRDHDGRKPVARLIDGWVGGHIAWDGYDPDWVAAAVGSRHVPEWGDGWIAHAYIPDGKAKKLCRHYTKLNGDKSHYGSIARPAQSPDGTKVLFHSTMLQQTNAKTDIYVAVSHRPAPPTDVLMKGVAADALGHTEVTIEWKPPKIRREIKGYHIYRRMGDNPDWKCLTETPVENPKFADTVRGAPIASVAYFATSVEHSGLESNRSSVVADRFGVEPGPAAIITGWDKKAPAPPTELKVEKTPNGPKLTWKASADKDVRYVNVYFSTKPKPEPKQGNRVASIIGVQEYLDWSAPKGMEWHYALTAVDRQGNEGKPAYSD